MSSKAESRTRLYALLCLLLTVSLWGAGYAANVFYRRAIASQLISLESHLQASHRDCSYLGVEYCRFGVEVPIPDSSILGDFHAWATKRFTGSSVLDYEIGSGTVLSHAYLLAVFNFEHEGIQTSHVFLWSPRRREFVHFQNWGAQSCKSKCSWRRDPECVGRSD